MFSAGVFARCHGPSELPAVFAASCEPCHRFRRQALLRLLVIREAEPQEFPFPWSSHRTLLAVHSQLELRREESRHAAHHSFAGSPTADVNVAIIRISCYAGSAPLYLPVQ